jgi:hypothetical protein
MNSTRKGKIARLPKPIRDELNQRIENGESGPELIAWLNPLPDVQRVLAEHFEDRPIRVQNISEWRQGGYQDWLQLQETRTLTLQVAEQSGTLADAAGAQRISEHFATVAAAEFIRTAQTLLRETRDTKERWACLKDIQLHLSRLRRDDCRVTNTAIRQERFTRQVAAEKLATKEAAVTEERRQILAYYQLQPHLREQVQKNGGDDAAYDYTAFLLELKHNLKTGIFGRKQPIPSAETPAPQPGPAAAPVPMPDAEPQTLEPRHQTPSSEAIPLDNEIRPMNLSEMPGIRVNPAKNALEIFPKPEAIRRPWPTQSN